MEEGVMIEVQSYLEELQSVRQNKAEALRKMQTALDELRQADESLDRFLELISRLINVDLDDKLSEVLRKGGFFGPMDKIFDFF